MHGKLEVAISLLDDVEKLKQHSLTRWTKSKYTRTWDSN